MDQVANLVFDLGMDSQKFRDEMPRVVKILQNASGESARAEARLKRFIESQNKASQEATAGAEVAVSAEGRQRQAAARTGAGHNGYGRSATWPVRRASENSTALPGTTGAA